MADLTQAEIAALLSTARARLARPRVLHEARRGEARDDVASPGLAAPTGVPHALQDALLPPVRPERAGAEPVAPEEAEVEPAPQEAAREPAVLNKWARKRLRKQLARSHAEKAQAAQVEEAESAARLRLRAALGRRWVLDREIGTRLSQVTVAQVDSMEDPGKCVPE